ncbi:MAG: HEAT repeat domain-containing protein, partial [Simkaniaceae bacterium]|nr:HEAT repeat domain-containing protein [Simkaniaceae bacterium]
GDSSYRNTLMNLAKQGNLFAITLLAEIQGSEQALKSLIKHPNIQIRYNAAVSLLRLHDAAAIPLILEILLSDDNDLGFFPQYSLGKSLMTWKVTNSAAACSKIMRQDIVAMTFDLKERLLQECMELDDTAFISIAEALFNHQKNSLLPLLVQLLENLNTKTAIDLLQKESSRIGAPFIRNYCHLSLYRLKAPGNHESMLMDFLKNKEQDELIKFRPMSSNMKEERSAFQLTPEETSRLLIESYETIANRHDENCILFLLNAIKNGNQKNRYAIAGLLLKAIQ